MREIDPLRMLVLTCALWLGITPLLHAAPLVEALRTLQVRGVRLAYSTDLVRPDMQAPEALPEGDAETVLKALLAPHGLTVRVTAGTFVVVRAPREGESRPDAMPDGALATDRGYTELERVDVTASSYRIQAETAASGTFMSRADVERMPHLGDELLRALDAVPGTTGGNITAQINIRGGAADEMAVMVDGMQLYEPFHLKNLQNAISIIDPRAVAGLEFMTGGYPVEYGDRMSGVLAIDTLRPARDAHDELGVSFVTAQALLQGGLGETDWLLSARRGYLDIILRFVDPGGDIRPTYADAFFKSVMPVGSASTLSLYLLGSRDHDEFEGDGDEERLEGDYGSTYGWLKLDTDWSDRLRSSSLLYHGRVTRAREGWYEKNFNSAAFADERGLDFTGIKTDWRLDLSADVLVKAGIEYRRLEADYSHSAATLFANPILIGSGPPIARISNYELEPEGRTQAAWLSGRVRLGETLIAELGLRADQQDYIADTTRQLSPRVNLRWDLDRGGVFKAGWGRFHQAQGLHELQVEDDITTFQPVERAEHRVLSWDSPWYGTLAFRFEAYDKRYSNLRPRFENLFDPIQLFPEAEPDRVIVAPDSARARGVEFTLRHRPSQRWGWWMSVVRSEAVDRIGTVDTPRSWDQPLSVLSGLSIGGGERWTFDAVLNYHDGWPTTELFLNDVPSPAGPVPVVSLGPRNGTRFPAYVDLSTRLSHRVALPDSTLVWYLEVSNLLARQNPCCVDGFQFDANGDGSYRVTPEYDYWLPIIPSFGVRWEF